MATLRRISVVVGGAALACGLVVAGEAWDPLVASATVPACPAPAISGSSATVTCAYTGGTQTWTVPAGITSATMTASGAAAGRYYSGPAGGSGGTASATFTVTP